METLHKDFNILIEKSRNENDKIESLKSKVKRLNSQLDELNEVRSTPCYILSQLLSLALYKPSLLLLYDSLAL